MDVPFALSVIFPVVTIVFIVLIILILIMMLMGKVCGGNENDSRKKEPEKPITTAVPPVQKPAAPKMVVQDGISDEVIAVIAAAIAAFTGGQGKILSVKKASRDGRKGRSAWSMAGLSDNTQPF